MEFSAAVLVEIEVDVEVLVEVLVEVGVLVADPPDRLDGSALLRRTTIDV